jgi:hypothetical protein
MQQSTEQQNSNNNDGAVCVINSENDAVPTPQLASPANNTVSIIADGINEQADIEASTIPEESVTNEVVDVSDEARGDAPSTQSISASNSDAMAAPNESPSSSSVGKKESSKHSQLPNESNVPSSVGKRKLTSSSSTKSCSSSVNKKVKLVSNEPATAPVEERV